MKHIMHTTKLVRELLENEPKTRNSDDLLYLKVCERTNASALNKPFWYVFANRNAMNVPPFESVRRARQKLQEHHPELRGTDDAEAQKVVNEQIMRDYARKVNV